MSEGNSDQSSAVAPPPPPCARESAENKCRSPAPSEHSSADTVDDDAVRASRPAVLQPISCAQDLELQVLLEQFAAKFFVVKFESFTPIFSRGGPLLNSPAPGFRLLQVLENFLQSQGDPSNMSAVFVVLRFAVLS